MPTQTFQYFVPVGSNSVSITAAMFGASGVTLDTIVVNQAVSTGYITPTGSLTMLKVLVDSKSDGQVLDLYGGTYVLMGTTQAALYGYSADFGPGITDWNGLNVNNSITIKNGTVSFYELHQPATGSAAGTFTVPNTTQEDFIQMFDPDSTQEAIRLATYPPQFGDRVTTFKVDARSFVLGSNTATPSGILSVTYDSGTSRYYNSGFTVTGVTLVNDIKTMLNSVVSAESSYSGRTAAATGIGLVMNINPNAIKVVTVSDYSEGLSGSDPIIGITFAGGTSSWPSRSSDSFYIKELNFFGRYSFGTTGASGTYYTYDSNTVTYKPLSGTCKNLYLPRVSDQGTHGLKLYSNGLNLIDGVTFIGAGKYDATHAGNIFYAIGGAGAILRLRNVNTFMGSGIYNTQTNGTWFDAEDCRFIAPALRAVSTATEDRITINRCEFINGLYSNSAIGRLNSDLGPHAFYNGMPECRITNSVFDFDSNHGQAISAYAGSFINTTITGNIFRNLPRPVSLQWSTNLEANVINQLEDYPGYEFSNNLVYVDQLPAKAAAGQSGLAYNGQAPQSIAFKLQGVIPGGPTLDGIYGITGAFAVNDNSTKYYIRLSADQLPRVKVPMIKYGYRILDGVGYLIGTIDRWDNVNNQENYLTSTFEILGRTGPTGSEFNGAIEIYLGASGSTSDTITGGITCGETLLMRNIPPITLKNNTIVLSRDLIENEGSTGHYVSNTVNLTFGGGSSGLAAGVASAGPMEIRNNIIYMTGNLQTTKRVGLSGGYDITTGATLDIAADGVYKGTISIQNGRSIVSENVFFEYAWNAEGFMDGYSGGADIQRKNCLSKSLGSTLDNAYKPTGPGGVLENRSDQLSAFDKVFTWNGGTGTVSPNAGYSGIGLNWSQYPKWEDIKNLGYTFSDVYNPLGVPVTPGSGYNVEFKNDYTWGVTFFGQTINKGYHTRTGTTLGKENTQRNTSDLFASNSNPTLHLGQPDVYNMDSSGFTLDAYSFHAAGIKRVEVSVDRGMASSMTYTGNLGGYTGTGYYQHYFDPTGFSAGSTYEVRVTSIPTNGLIRTKQMLLSYVSGENKVTIGTTQGISAGWAAIRSNWDPRKRNIIELGASGNYIMGTNPIGNETYTYGWVEVIPAAGVSASIDLSRFLSGTTDNNLNYNTRPQMHQMKFKNITFRSMIQPGMTQTNAGIYLEDTPFKTRWWIDGCTLQSNWFSGTSGATAYWAFPNGTPLYGVSSMFRSAYYQRMYFTDTFGSENQGQMNGAMLVRGCTQDLNFQDSYTNTMALIDSSSTRKLTPINPALHADHYQLFYGTTGPFTNNDGITFESTADGSETPPVAVVMNHMLYNYYGFDYAPAGFTLGMVQPFGFFGTRKEYYKDIAHIRGKWGAGETSGSGLAATSAIAVNYDHVLFLGLTLEAERTVYFRAKNDGFLSIQWGPVLMQGVSAASITNSYQTLLNPTNQPGSINQFKALEPLTPDVVYNGIASDDSLLRTFYQWHISGASMASVASMNIYANDATGSSVGLNIGITAQNGPGVSGSPISTMAVFGLTGNTLANWNPNARMAYVNGVSYDNTNDAIFTAISTTYYGAGATAEAIAWTGVTAGWYMKITTDEGFMYSATPASKRVNNNQIDFSGFASQQFGGVTLTNAGITGSATGVTFELRRLP